MYDLSVSFRRKPSREKRKHEPTHVLFDKRHFQVRMLKAPRVYKNVVYSFFVVAIISILSGQRQVTRTLPGVIITCVITERAVKHTFSRQCHATNNRGSNNSFPDARMLTVHRPRADLTPNSASYIYIFISSWFRGSPRAFAVYAKPIHPSLFWIYYSLSALSVSLSLRYFSDLPLSAFNRTSCNIISHNLRCV